MASRVTRSRRQQPPQQQEQSRARWTMHLTKILASLMVEQVYKGNKKKNSFGKKAWECMCDEFYRRTGLQWDKEQLKNRYAVLRRQYVTVKSLMDRSDFSFDETAGTIIAKDEAWAAYIRDYPDADTLKTSGCPIYKELCTIFSDSFTNGIHGQSVEGNPSLCMVQELSSESEEEDDVDHQGTVQPATPSTPNVRKRGRKGTDGAIADAILEMAAASKMRTSAIQRWNARYSITKCIQELDETQDVDEQLYFAAIELFDKPIARETFLSLKGDKRLTWLRSKCKASTNPIPELDKRTT
ncbi:hypothetical protein TIFTF001_002265 [Ficus carica]|uniref:Myb/SANT-like domain-containing protein n=1 Tax=Ficus carica TaxID=3494 RepID=A0AA87Z577_FICCA|nr:hypothetical protein TIFTF001_002265 [Ficus carica]